MEFSFKIKFIFIDLIGGNRSLKLNNKGNDEIVLECINFEMLGAGTKIPVKIATIKDKDVFIQFFTAVEADNCRKLEFSLCMERGTNYEKW